MSKKIEKTTIEKTVEEAIEKRTLRSYMEEYTNVSLLKLAKSQGLSPNWILKCAKDPIPGQPYDPNSINYEKVSKIFFKKNIDFDSIDWESLNQATRSINIVVDKNMEAYNEGDLVYLRDDNETPYRIRLKTETHVIVMKDNETVPHCYSSATFLQKGPSKTKRSKTIEAKVTVYQGDERKEM